MDQARLGERLRVARSAAGLTQEHAAEKLGVARTTLVAIEGGDRPPRPEELVALADLYRVGVHTFLRPSAVRVDLVGQFRRKRTGREGKVDREGIQALTLLHDLAAAYVELERRRDPPEVLEEPRELLDEARMTARDRLLNTEGHERGSEASNTALTDPDPCSVGSTPRESGEREEDEGPRPVGWLGVRPARHRKRNCERGCSASAFG